MAYLGWTSPKASGGLWQWVTYDFSGYGGLRILGFAWGPDGR